ncbi:MAG: FG-GAP repeat domain-containing protein, partial [Acidobacteriota bacterium]
MDQNDTGTDPFDADSDDDGFSDEDEVAAGSDPNDSNSIPGFPVVEENVISTAADGAVSVFAADVDGDGDLDVLSASFADDKIAWYENTDGAGSFGSQQVISTAAVGARSVYAADLDGDGDADVLSASASDDKIAWYENLGSGTFSAQNVISTAADWPMSVYATDLDGDGD